MRRWAIVNKRNEEEIVDLGWSSNSYTQKDAENYALRCKMQKIMLYVVSLE